jgi:hypothetical protein
MYNNDFRDTCASERAKIMNSRSYSRVVPSKMLQPYLSVPPAQTKFSVLPIVDPRKQINVPMEQLPTYNIHTTFNPGDNGAPWSGFASSVNVESELRNQIYALQKCSQSVYVPNSKSDLYKVNFASAPANQPFPNLFTEYASTPNPYNSLKDRMGPELFNNSTRTQRENC